MDEKNPLVNEKNKKISSFSIFVEQRSDKGGVDKTNDCLFKCLIEAGINRYKCPQLFRNMLHIKKGEMIGIEYMSKIEKMIRTNIIVSGEATYQSDHKYEYTIYLMLKDKHYTIDKKSGKPYNLNHYCIKEEREIVVYNGNYKTQEVEYCSKSGYGSCKYDDINFGGKIWIKMKDIQKMNGDFDNVKDAYKYCIEQIDMVKKYTDEKINMYKTGWISPTVRYWIHNYIQKLHPKIDNITQKESDWIEHVTRGAYVYCKKGIYDGKFYSYDHKGSYPSIFNSQYFKIPISTPKFTTITQEQFDNMRKSPNYGIYRCIVEDGNPKFKYNYNNFYTHFVLEIARKEGLKIDIIMDDVPNYMSYEHKVSSSRLFGYYIETMYKLKEDHPECKLLKLLVSTIHGCLCQKKRTKHHINISGEKTEIECEDDEFIENCYDTGKNKACIVTCRTSLYHHRLPSFPEHVDPERLGGCRQCVDSHAM